ncbi:DUF1868 domain-containing protein [Vibrio sp. S12_S33]|uniref:DUF1868 domain-containing protein n=1 Tax=Vibrio sp. S12_S33 TaxID=2720223 RepID=UPI001780ED2A|nr:DUF1868 domain-containing protein [Vibrio sp. S12_S33]MBD1566328.1 DUF1868 domain-containing protein [Vibrio sp. S12_S33]
MKFTKNVGMKFNEDGSFRGFPGNTFICHLEDNSKHLELTMWAQNKIKALPFSYKFSFLPRESMHMTVFEGVCEQVREQDKWTNKLGLDANLDETTKLFLKQLENISQFDAFTLKFDRMYHYVAGGIALRLNVTDEYSEKTIKNCRSELSNITGIRMSDFDSYFYHISLGYEIVELNEDEKAQLYKVFQEIEVELLAHFGELTHKKLDFCHFSNMSKFEPIKTFNLI